MTGFWALNRNGEETLYRDERKFVMNLSKGFVERDNEKIERYILTTYENTNLLPILRSDEFESKEDAEIYVQFHEPLTPIATNDGKSLDLDGPPEEMYASWLLWLDERGLLPTLSGFQHVPEHIARRLNDYPTADTPYKTIVYVDTKSS